MQGDCLSLSLFILSINPLSFLLKKLPSYKIGPPRNRNHKISHLFFVDDLKTYAQDRKVAKLQLDLITTFSNDISMQFGNDKCAYLYIEKGNVKSLGEQLIMNNIRLNELPEGDTYKYLGQDESVGYNGQLNKEKVLKEYYKRVRKIWSSELYARNKVTAHNVFALPIITPTIGILEWTKLELEQVDVKTRKLLTLSGSFHRNSDIDRLYTYRDKGGRGLNSLADLFISRIISISQHVTQHSNSNILLSAVRNHEEESIIRISNELINSFSISMNDENATPKQIAYKVKQALKENHRLAWIKKPQHGYLYRTREKASAIKEKSSYTWLKSAPFSSHVEGYLCAIQEEEINCRSLQAKRDPTGRTNPICRLCHSQPESIQHIIAACPKLSNSMYLPLRHNKVANVIYQNIEGERNEHRSTKENYYDDKIEMWWDTKIKTLTKLEHNRPDIVLWKRNERKCFVIDISVGLDVNVSRNHQAKIDNYLPLLAELKRLYPEYVFDVVPIVIGATGFIDNNLKVDLEKLDVVNLKNVMKQCQKLALLGTLKIVKSFMKM